MRFAFGAGGTGGHIFPAVSIANEVRRRHPDAEILFVGAEGRMETDLIPRAGYEIKTVRITNITRSLKPAAIAHNLKTVKNVFDSTREARRIISEFKPDVVVGTGGYVCYPVIKAAHELGIPTAVHESNAVPGLTTKLLESSSDVIMVGFEESRENYKYPERVKVTGTPVRGGFFAEDKRAARAALGLGDVRPMVASVWGSLGAAHMNAVMTDFIARESLDDCFDLIHATGRGGYESMIAELDEKCPGYRAKGADVRDYIYDMSRVMAAADLVLCRAGASTLAELTAMGKPAVLVPSPNVTNNHQEKNARVLEAAGGAVVLLESEFTAEKLYDCVSELLADPDRLAEMSANMLCLGIPDATDRIAAIILGLASRDGD